MIWRDEDQFRERLSKYAPLHRWSDDVNYGATAERPHHRLSGSSHAMQRSFRLSFPDGTLPSGIDRPKVPSLLQP
jgi:hypothetical protein